MNVRRRDTADPGPGFGVFDRKLACSSITSLSGELKRTVAGLCVERGDKDELQYGREVLLDTCTHLVNPRLHDEALRLVGHRKHHLSKRASEGGVQETLGEPGVRCEQRSRYRQHTAEGCGR